MFSSYRNPSLYSFSSVETGSTTSFAPADHEDGWGNQRNGLPITLPAQSQHGIVTVYQYTPQQGEAGTKLTVSIAFKQLPGRVIGLRVVFGGVGLRTLVAQGHGRGHWQLRADIPDVSSAGSPHPHNLKIEALEGGNVIDSVDFGIFTFWDAGTCPPPNPLAQHPGLSRHRSFEHRNNGRHSPLMQRTTNQYKTNSLTALAAATVSAPSLAVANGVASGSPPRSQLGGPAEHYRIVRRTEIPIERESSALSVVMNIHGDLRSMSSGWSQDEVRARRRLVQFWRHMEGNIVNVHFCPIKPEEYDDSRIVVSCIYREDVDKCYITSFDLIRLLEGIIGSVCNIDEKNRIRRNVHHIEHDTISKSKPYHEEFFDLIMSFPTPMPRRNVRDLKAFRWEYLGEALHAIIDKMALDYCPTPFSEMVEPSIPEVPEPPAEPYSAYNTSMNPEPLSSSYGQMDDSMYDAVDASFEFSKPQGPIYESISPNISSLSFHSHHSPSTSITNFHSPNASVSDFYSHTSPNASLTSFHNQLSPNGSVTSFQNNQHHRSPSTSATSFHTYHSPNASTTGFHPSLGNPSIMTGDSMDTSVMSGRRTPTGMFAPMMGDEFSADPYGSRPRMGSMDAPALARMTSHSSLEGALGMMATSNTAYYMNS
ncbi:hypothetical protein FRC02_008700 [Tulasnella sp. 418]|nr:hypothetical protein FRC02_008700 [Tulasnella sp. 418]